MIGTFLWTVAIISWVTVFQLNRVSWGVTGENLSFIIPDGRPWNFGCLILYFPYWWCTKWTISICVCSKFDAVWFLKKHVYLDELNNKKNNKKCSKWTFLMQWNCCEFDVCVISVQDICKPIDEFNDKRLNMKMSWL